jgi:hypothetical protein
MDTKTPTYDIDAILANRKNKDVVTALLEALYARKDASKSAKFLGREKDIYWLDLVHSGIFCDGIDGTLSNYGLAPLVFAVGGFKRVWAVEKAIILREALRSFGEPEPGRELPTKFNLPPTPEQKKLFEELDDRFIRAKENFSELAVAYVEKHIEEFRSYGSQGELAQPGAAPNGGPAMRLGSSGASGGPPSVS